jgi:hypothetical protein
MTTIHCTCCGLIHSAQHWLALPYVGMQQTARIPREQWAELRNCDCGSTLSVEYRPGLARERCHCPVCGERPYCDDGECYCDCAHATDRRQVVCRDPDGYPEYDGPSEADLWRAAVEELAEELGRERNEARRAAAATLAPGAAVLEVQS